MSVLNSPAAATPPYGAAGDQTRGGEALDVAAVGAPSTPAVAAPRLPVIGVDLSLTASGLALFHPNLPEVYLYRVGSKGKKTDTFTDRGRRLLQLRGDVLARIPPDALVVIEGPAYAQGTDPSYFDRSGAWWLLVTALQTRGHQVVVVTTSSLKKYATGKGNAGKDQVLAAVVKRFPDIDVTDNNIADAVTLLAMALDHYGQPLADMPAAHRIALQAVAWPHPTGAVDE